MNSKEVDRTGGPGMLFLAWLYDCYLRIVPMDAALGHSCVLLYI